MADGPWNEDALEDDATPRNTIYTHSMNDPLGGSRAAHRSERTDATALTVADRGGGFIILPGTYSSDFRDQGASQATFGRARVLLAGASGTGSVGALFADRNYVDGSSNRVASVDAVDKPSNEMRLRAQGMASQTRDAMAGSRSNSYAIVTDGFDDNGSVYLYARYTAIAPKFRADNSILAQNGYSTLELESRQCQKVEGFFNQMCPGLNAKEQRAWNNTPLNRYVTPVLTLNGKRNSFWNVQPRWLNYTRTRDGGAWHHIPTLFARGESNPNTRFPYLFFESECGRGVDLATSTRARLIGQRSMSRRNAEIYAFAVTLRSHTQAVSLVYSHKRGLGHELNVGVTHGNARASLRPDRATTEIFAKLSWAFAN